MVVDCVAIVQNMLSPSARACPGSNSLYSESDRDNSPLPSLNLFNTSQMSNYINLDFELFVRLCSFLNISHKFSLELLIVKSHFSVLS